jgi:sodium-dependent dicarboxylate transporter 2/3/5
MLFLGCLTLALAVEKSNLHQRIALKVLLSIGTQFQWLLLGFMLTTMFLSMWIVSTATVAMMLPIADEILAHLFPKTNSDDNKKLLISNECKSKLSVIIDFNDDFDSEKKNKLSKLLYLCIAYSATIGSSTTLTSNGPNLIMKFILEE